MRAQSNKNTFSQYSRYLNGEIRFSNFLLIGKEGENMGLVEREEALRMARDNELDLFCITPSAKPPVCKILDFSKYLYQLKKKDAGKSVSKKNLFKEAKFSFAISENDAAVKIKKILKWLENGSTVKVILFMRGREQQHKDLALQKVNKILTTITDASPFFQLREEVKLIGNTYLLIFFRNKKTQGNEKD